MKTRLAFLFASFPLIAAAGSFDKGGINGVGARAMGMGGAVAAQPGDASSLWWNPAGLVAQDKYEIYYQYASELGGKNLDHVLAQRGLIPELDFSYGLGYRRRMASSAFGFTEQTTLLSLAFPFTDDKRLDFGASMKLYNTQLENVPGGEAHGFGMDMGFLYNPPIPGNGLTLGLSVLDFQTGLDWATGFADSPPQLMQLGASYTFDKSTIVELDSEVVTDHVHSTRSNQGFRAGVERWFDFKKIDAEKFFAFRLGYLQNSSLAPTSLSGLFSMGAGFSWRNVKLDYAYLQDLSNLGESHRISGSYLFDPFVSESKTTPVKTAAPAPKITATPTPAPEPKKGVFNLVPDADVFAPGGGSRRKYVNFAVGYDGGPITGYSLVITRQGTETPLRTLRGKVLPMSLRWDGMNQQSKAVSDGSYIATLRIVPESGPAMSAVSRVDVDTRKPKVALEVYPKIFEPGNEAKAVGVSPKTDNLTGIPARWELLIESFEGKRVKLFEGKGSPPEKVTWSGVNDQGGKVANESLFYVTYLLEMESGALAKTARMVLGSEVTAFKEQSAIKVTLATAKFASNDEGVALEEYKALKEAAEAVKKYGAEYLVQVLGYTDTQEAGGPVSALELSYLRAKAVRDYLVDAGALDAARVKAMGFGSERPTGDNANDEGRAKNRRVDVILFTK